MNVSTALSKVIRQSALSDFLSTGAMLAYHSHAIHTSYLIGVRKLSDTYYFISFLK